MGTSGAGGSGRAAANTNSKTEGGEDAETGGGEDASSESDEMSNAGDMEELLRRANLELSGASTQTHR